MKHEHQGGKRFTSIQGGGFVSYSPNRQNKYQRFRARELSSDGQTSNYSVKYLGIVDGNMGILSHKAVMQGQGTLATNKSIQSLSGESEIDSRNILNKYGPVLNGKNYTQLRLKRPPDK